MKKINLGISLIIVSTTAISAASIEQSEQSVRAHSPQFVDTTFGEKGGGQYRILMNSHIPLAPEGNEDEALLMALIPKQYKESANAGKVLGIFKGYMNGNYRSDIIRLLSLIIPVYRTVDNFIKVAEIFKPNMDISYRADIIQLLALLSEEDRTPLNLIQTSKQLTNTDLNYKERQEIIALLEATTPEQLQSILITNFDS